MDLRPRLGDRRFGQRLVLILALLWSGDSPVPPAGLLSFLFGAVVLWTAHNTVERPAGSGLIRWHEGAFLLVLGLVLLFWFGPKDPLVSVGSSCDKCDECRDRHATLGRGIRPVALV